MGWLGRFFARKELDRQAAESDSLRAHVRRLRGERPRLRATYDAAGTTRINQNLWAAVGTDAEPSAADRKILRQRAGYEVKNNSFACGMLQTRAADVVGRGPRLQLLGDDDAENARGEVAFAAWAEEIKLGQKLTLAEVQQTQAGECFLRLETNEALDSAVKLDIGILGAERVTSPADKALKVPKNYSDGIQYDANGNPVSYDVLDKAPSSSSLVYGALGAATTFPASQIIHLYQRIRPAQLRGVTELASCLELFAQLRRYTLAVLTAAETAADIAVFLESQGAEGGVTQIPGNEFAEQDIARGMATSLPVGWTMKQITAEQPHTEYSAFKRELLNEIARCLGMPLNIALANSAGYNYASGRLDHQIYFKLVRVRQSNLARNALRPILQAWAREAALAGSISANLDIATYDWFFDGFEHVDPAKEATAQKTRLSSGTTTLARECAREGIDWQVLLRQRARELGITVEEYQELMRARLEPKGAAGAPAAEAGKGPQLRNTMGA